MSRTPIWGGPSTSAMLASNLWRGGTTAGPLGHGDSNDFEPTLNPLGPLGAWQSWHSEALMCKTRFDLAYHAGELPEGRALQCSERSPAGNFRDFGRTADQVKVKSHADSLDGS